MKEYPDTWFKRGHAKDCDGNLFRRRETVCVDRLGRVGNGGIVAHLYICNRHWAPCPARVLVAERAVRLLAVASLRGEENRDV